MSLYSFQIFIQDEWKGKGERMKAKFYSAKIKAAYFH